MQQNQASSTPAQNPTPDRIVRVKECERLTGLTNVSLWRMEKTGDFPKRVKLTAGTVGWKLSAVLDWIDSRPSA